MRQIETIAAEYTAARIKAVELRNELFEALDPVIVNAFKSYGMGGAEDTLQECREKLLVRLWLRCPDTVTDFRSWIEARTKWFIMQSRYAPASRGATFVADHELATFRFEHPSDPMKPVDRLAGSSHGRKFPRVDKPDDEYTPSDDDRSKLRSAIAELPETQRDAMTLHLAGRSNSEIAVELKTTGSAVRSLLRRARDQIKSTIQGAG